MKPTERLRALLDDYYAGCSSPEQIAEIKSLLNSISPLPDDLVIEKAIFDSIDKTAQESTPEPDRLKAIFENPTTQKASRRHTLYIWWAASAAALIAIVVTIGGSILKSTHTNNAPEPLTAQTVTYKKTEITKTPTKQPDDTPIDTDHEIQNNIIQPPKTPDNNNPANCGSRHSNRQFNQQPKSESNLIIVTDPDEAQRYTAMVDNMIASAIIKTGEASRQAADAIEKANAGLDRVLNKTLQQKI